MSDISLLPLEGDAHWQDFAVNIDPLRRHVVVTTILNRLRDSGVQSAIIEEQYLDRDYTQEFSKFYGKQFRRYRRRTRRVHFFRTKADVLSAQATAAVDVVRTIESASEGGDYLGFVVLRPVDEAPIGRSVLHLPRQVPGLSERVQVRALYDAHLLGAELSFKGVPFMQQDSRLSACAQASIWMCGRHFHTRDAGPWFSTADITEAASKPTDMSLSQSLPPGANSLSADNMLRALTAMGRQPYLYCRILDQPSGKPVWPTQLSPRSILARYADSGIPIVLMLGPWATGERIGHAVVVTGSTFASCMSVPPLGTRPTAAEFCPYFLVHDDQRGPHLRMPVADGLPLAETPYNLADQLAAIIIPLPDHVFISAEESERVAWDFMQQYAIGWDAYKRQHSASISTSASLGDDFASQLNANTVVARTYLTFGWRYQARLISNLVPDALKTAISEHELPRLIWVTEFSRFADLNHQDAADRRVVAHCVVDATSSQISSCRLVFHAPGYLSLWSQDAPAFFPQIPQSIYPIRDDRPYLPRVPEDP